MALNAVVTLSVIIKKCELVSTIKIKHDRGYTYLGDRMYKQNPEEKHQRCESGLENQQTLFIKANAIFHQVNRIIIQAQSH